MRKYVARNRKTYEHVFCKYELCPTGVLKVEYYLPKNGFSLIWNRQGELTRISGLRTSKDGRKSIVTFFIHPRYWLGDTLSVANYGVVNGIECCLTDNIKLL